MKWIDVIECILFQEQILAEYVKWDKYNYINQLNNVVQSYEFWVSYVWTGIILIYKQLIKIKLNLYQNL